MKTRVFFFLGAAAILSSPSSLGQVNNPNPEGSLNFSSPPRAHGPFDDAGAKAFYRRQDWDGLVDYTRAWVNASPKNGFAWFALGEGAYKSGNYDAAVEGFRRATMYSPNEPRPWANLSAAYSKRQQWNLASKALTDGMASSGSHCTAEDWYVFGNALKSLDSYEAAIGAYNKALQLNPNFSEANNNKGVCLAALGNDAAAKGSYAKAAREGNKYASQNINALNENERMAQQAASQSSSHPGFSFKTYNDGLRRGDFSNH